MMSSASWSGPSLSSYMSLGHLVFIHFFVLFFVSLFAVCMMVDLSFCSSSRAVLSCWDRFGSGTFAAIKPPATCARTLFFVPVAVWWSQSRPVQDSYESGTATIAVPDSYRARIRLCY